MVVKITAYVDEELNRRMWKYISLRWGGGSSYGKISEVMRRALERFLDEELNKLEAEKEA